MPILRREYLTPEEARRALYIDFEGRRGRPPVLLGCMRQPSRGPEPRVWQAVLDPALTALGEPDGLETLSLAGAIERIIARAEHKERLIVAWSEHELRVVGEACSPAILERFGRRFVNARRVAVRWARAYAPTWRPDENSLTEPLTHLTQ